MKKRIIKMLLKLINDPEIIKAICANIYKQSKTGVKIIHERGIAK